jgi:hypothetical protein
VSTTPSLTYNMWNQHMRKCAKSPTGISRPDKGGRASPVHRAKPQQAAREQHKTNRPANEEIIETPITRVAITALPEWLIEKIDEAHTEPLKRMASLKRFQTRLIENLRRSGEWISFAEIAEWCARERGSIEVDEKLREVAYEQLGNSVSAGEFGSGRRSRVLFLHPRSTYAKMTQERWESMPSPGVAGRQVYLPYCWIPAPLAATWFDARNIRRPPRLAAVATASTHITPSPTPDAHIRTPEEPAAQAMQARTGRPTHRKSMFAALDRLMADGHRVLEMAPGRLSKLIAHECDAKINDPGWSPRTVRDHIRAWRDENAGNSR